MGKIFCIIGKSSSGKDTIYKRIKDCYELEENVMFTTRPMRVGEEDGRDYFFVTDEEFKSMAEKNLVVESRTYDTKFGPWTYFTSSVNFKNDNNYIVVNTLEGFNSLKTSFGDSNVIPIYINIDDGLRLERALKRERKEENPKYEELCRRFLADQKDFSSDKVIASGIKIQFENNDLEECVKQVSDYIEGFGVKKNSYNQLKKEGIL